MIIVQSLYLIGHIYHYAAQGFLRLLQQAAAAMI